MWFTESSDLLYQPQNSGNPHLETEPTSMILKRLAAALRTHDYLT